jgi:protein-tyrosine phosphatase
MNQMTRENIIQIITIKYMSKMVDLHTHLLPQMDDGASSTEEAVAIIEKLQAQKIVTAVCTPHFDASKMYLPEFLNRRTAAMNILNGSPVCLLTGSETVCNEFLFHYSDISPLCMEHTRYLLLEIPFCGLQEDELYGQIKELMTYYRIYPIIAHIERYDAIFKNKVKIRKLKQMGCMIQMNADFVIGKKSVDTALKSIKKGYIDILASDCHNLAHRPPNLAEAYNRVRHYLGYEYCHQLETNCNLILEGKKLRGSTYYII